VAIKLLIIDDDEVVLDFLRHKLRREFTVSTHHGRAQGRGERPGPQPKVVLCDSTCPT
jgi:DNA-binding NtrC family response regulator